MNMKREFPVDLPDEPERWLNMEDGWRDRAIQWIEELPAGLVDEYHPHVVAAVAMDKTSPGNYNQEQITGMFGVSVDRMGDLRVDLHEGGFYIDDDLDCEIHRPELLSQDTAEALCDAADDDHCVTVRDVDLSSLEIERLEENGILIPIDVMSYEEKLDHDRANQMQMYHHTDLFMLNPDVLEPR